MESGPMPDTPPPDRLKDPCYVNAMVHFYRGELGRIMIWRQRLDITSTWAITSTTTIITVAFSFRDIPHLVFFFNLAIVWIMLWIEARRYRFYDAFRGRVRMLEAHFYVPMISGNPGMLKGEWERLVCEDLILPSFKISKLEAVGRRLKRNYIFIFAIILVAWITKIFMHANPRIDSPQAFLQALSVGHLPGWLVGGILLMTVLFAIGLTWYVAVNTPGEISDLRGGTKDRWRL